jgi:hypothetical protein
LGRQARDDTCVCVVGAQTEVRAASMEGLGAPSREALPALGEAAYSQQGVRGSLAPPSLCLCVPSQQAVVPSAVPVVGPASQPLYCCSWQCLLHSLSWWPSLDSHPAHQVRMSKRGWVRPGKGAGTDRWGALTLCGLSTR